MHARHYIYETAGHQGIQAAWQICNIRPLKVKMWDNVFPFRWKWCSFNRTMLSHVFSKGSLYLLLKNDFLLNHTFWAHQCSSNKREYHHTENSMMYTDEHKPLTFSLCTCASNFLVQKEPSGSCFKIPLMRCIFFATSYSFKYKHEKYRQTDSLKLLFLSSVHCLSLFKIPCFWNWLYFHLW